MGKNIVAKALIVSISDYLVSSIFRRYSNSARLGDLLVQAGVLSPAQLQEAVKHSRSKKLQIGQVLVMSGHLKPKDLQVALEAQSMLKDKTIDINIAVQCIKVARKIGSSFADVLEDYDPNAAKVARTGKLGELLVEAGLITQDQLNQAMEQGFNTGMPLGRMLVLNEAVHADLLDTILDIQVRLRDEMMSRDEAIAALKKLTGKEETATPEPVVQKPQEKKQVVRLGELLVMAGILTENDVMDALELGIANQQPIGQVLVSQQLISQSLLDAALYFQTCVKSDELDPLKACECLSEVFSTGVSPEEALKEVTTPKGPDAPDKPPIDYRTLVTMSRAVTDEEIDKAFSITSQDAALIGKVLVLTGFIDVPTLQATLRCYQMVSRGWLKPDDAIAALDYCLHQNQNSSPSFEQALRDLKWSPETGLKMRGEVNLMKKTGENMQAYNASGSSGTLNEPTAKPTQESVSASELDAIPTPEPAQETTAVSELDAIPTPKPAQETTAVSELDAIPTPQPAQETTAVSELDAIPTPKPAQETTAVSELDAIPTPKPAQETTAVSELDAIPTPKPAQEAAAVSELDAIPTPKPAQESSAVSELDAIPTPKPAQETTAVSELDAIPTPKPAQEAAAVSELDAIPTPKPAQESSAVSELDAIPTPKPAQETTAVSELDAIPTPKPAQEEAAASAPDPVPSNNVANLLEEDEDSAQNATGPLPAQDAPNLDSLLSPLHDGDDSVNESPTKEEESVPIQVEPLEQIEKQEDAVPAVETKESNEAKETGSSSSSNLKDQIAEPVSDTNTDDDTDSGGGLGALLQGISGGQQEVSKAAQGKKKMGGLLGGLIQKTSTPEDTKENDKIDPPSEPSNESESKEVSQDSLNNLSAEELIEQIAQSSNPEDNQHDSAKGVKRKGRFSETIMPEAAKARQLAQLISKESAAVTENFDNNAESDDALGTAFERLAERHFEQGNYKEAQVIYERILVHKLNDMGPENAELIEDYNNLAMTLCVQGLFDKAEPFMKKAVSLYENKENAEPLALADYLHSLGTIHFRMDRLEDAESSLSRVLELRKTLLDREHEDIGRTLADYAKVVKKLGQSENAEVIYKKAKDILKQNSKI